MRTKEEARAYNADYYQGHKDELRSEKAAYDASHRDEKHEYDTAYYASHRDEILAGKGAYYAEHREARHAYNAVYYALFTEWLHAQGACNGCEDCGTHEGLLEHHHVDPTTKLHNVSQMIGHSLKALEDELEKCVVLCRSCHKKRHSKEGT